MKKKQAPERDEKIEDFILETFEDNFQRIKFESGHGLAPEVKEAAKRQVLLYWRRLKEVAETITDTEVRLNLPGQETPKKRKFNIEGVVDIVRAEGKTVMYDLKTHDPDYIRQNIHEYEKQLNIYAHIWHNLRGEHLYETAVVATQLPESLDRAWENREQDPATLEQELQKWNPIIPIPFNSKHAQNTIQELGEAVDNIEEGSYSPAHISRLNRREVKNQTFGTRVCRNCDVRFSCRSYRQYVKSAGSSNLPKFREIYEDAGTENDREVRMNAAMQTVLSVGGLVEEA